jgi:PAS domain S-box-containing protein
VTAGMSEIERRRLEKSGAEPDSNGLALRRAMDAGKISTFEWDVEQNHLTWTGPVENLSSIAQITNGGSIEDFAAIVHDVDRQRLLSQMRQAVQSGVPFSNEFRVVIDGGETRWIECRGDVVKGVTGKIARLVGIAYDVTEHRRLEKDFAHAQLLAEQRYAELRAVYTSAPVGLAFMDQDLRFVTINETLAQINGHSAQAHIGRSLREILPLKLFEAIEPYHRRALRGERVENVELRGPNPTRPEEFHDWLVSYIPVIKPSKEIIGVNVVVQDITEQKRGETALRASESQYRLLFNSIDQGFCIIEMLFDENGKPHDYRFLECNAMFEHLTGLKNATGKTASELVPNLESHWFEIYGKVALTGDAVRFVDGSEAMKRWFDVYASRVGGAESRRLAILFTNITERKQFESEREGHILALKESNRRKTEFLAMLSHELRNPLAPLRNMLEIMKRADLTGNVLENARNVMDRQLRQLENLVDDLLDVNRIGQGKIELRFDRLELMSVVHHAVEAISSIFVSAGQELSVTVPPKAIYVNGDATRLAQVLENLLVNASKYSAKGNGIWLTVEQEGDAAVIRVRDSGIGISAENLPIIFDMFAQVDSVLAYARQGLGVGLALVKNLVEMHGGTVQATSRGTGHGSEFTVRLPIVSYSPAPSVPATGATASRHSTSRRILIVDDNVDAAESLAMLLSLTGHDTQQAHDGLKALEAAEAFRPDVVLLDIGLPGLNGYEVARKIRAQLWGGSMVLVAVTGWGQENDRRKSREAGFNVHIVKPVDCEALLKLLDDGGVPP